MPWGILTALESLTGLNLKNKPKPDNNRPAQLDQANNSVDETNYQLSISVINETSWGAFQTIDVSTEVGIEKLATWLRDSIPTELDRIKLSFEVSYSTLDTQTGLILLLKKIEQVSDSTKKNELMRMAADKVFIKLYKELLLIITTDVTQSDLKLFKEALDFLKEHASPEQISLLLLALWKEVVLPYMAAEAKKVKLGSYNISQIVEEVILLLSEYDNKDVLVKFMQLSEVSKFNELVASTSTCSSKSRFEEKLLPGLVSWFVSQRKRDTSSTAVRDFFNIAIMPYVDIKNEAEGK